MECDICADIALKARSSKKLTEIILECWQREYGRRPYLHFIFHGNVFERKFFRKMTADDFLLVLTFIETRTVKHFEFLHCTVPNIHAQHFLKCLDNLVSVNFTHSNVPMEMFRYLAENAKTLILETLMLCGNSIDEQKSEYLRMYLIQTKRLFHFDVSNCGINHITLAIIADGILHCKNLQSIDVSDIAPHHPQYIIDTSKIAVILSILIWSSQLLEVHFRKIKIDGSGMATMCDNFSVSFLRILDIGANAIGPDGTDALFKALKYSNVAALIMPFNKIGDVGGKIIAENLRFTTLKHLDISYNEISSQTMELILTNLTKCNTMKTLNIYGNDFSSQTIGSVLHILIINHILNPRGLDVSINYVGDVHQIFPVENQILNNFQESLKLSKYCVKEKISPRTMMWFKKNLRQVMVGYEIPNIERSLLKIVTQNFSCVNINE